MANLLSVLFCLEQTLSSKFAPIVFELKLVHVMRTAPDRLETPLTRELIALPLDGRYNETPNRGILSSAGNSGLNIHFSLGMNPGMPVVTTVLSLTRVLIP